ncbi:RNase H domain-containing protein [Aphis craccivora]|uniref:RNase H domain-containing protein n=1 Tax=Aphis craccivora TaxID=307492 RepID=A0A6G0XZL3_APHCR|nr:RNase H domain-containing protein [Aphis craccivora]
MLEIKLNKKTTSLWQNIWNIQTNKLNQIKKTVKRWKRNPNISIPNEKKLNRARIGHTRMTHGYLMAKEDPPICQTCVTTLTIKHIFDECSSFQTQRKELNISHDVRTNFGPYPENEINTIEFFKATKLLNLL